MFTTLGRFIILMSHIGVMMLLCCEGTLLIT
uniref:Uncharacterized protein n=1 Tax=Anguilla anguilla TaxID=7936 RepID=A0A0E9VAB3_ANGAN